MDLFSLIAIIIVALIAGGIYEVKKKNDIKLEQIKLEREKIALEQKRLEIYNKTD